jgi:hypothetical protein
MNQYRGCFNASACLAAADVSSAPPRMRQAGHLASVRLSIPDLAFFLQFRTTRGCIGLRPMSWTGEERKRKKDETSDKAGIGSERHTCF